MASLCDKCKNGFNIENDLNVFCNSFGCVFNATNTEVLQEVETHDTEYLLNFDGQINLELSNGMLELSNGMLEYEDDDNNNDDDDEPIVPIRQCEVCRTRLPPGNYEDNTENHQQCGHCGNISQMQ